MPSPVTSLTRYGGTYTFTSQSSTTFTFRIPDGFGAYINANPDDYKNQFPVIRGEVKETIGGGTIIQEFGQYNNDRIITFSTLLTKAEYVDLLAAKALLYEWTLVDQLGDSWRVKFDPSEGMENSSKIRANDKTLINFKFRVIASA